MSIFGYGGRFARITIVGGEVRDGFYCFAVDTDECTADGEDVIGMEESHKESVPLATLRLRADANARSLAEEVQAVKDAAVVRAQERFKDAVDVESLG